MAESKFEKLSSSGPPFSASQLENGLDDALDDLRRGSMPEVGGLIGGKYRVERLIACGGMGAVYAATHTVSGKRVAVKWMLSALGQIKGARERFIREACATARIAHPNIVDIYDVGTESGSVYLVMEYLRGETLAQRMSRSPLSEQDTVTLLLPALRGVAAAHAHGVIHRDLKPDNIFLCCTDEGEELEPKVLDFGISKITTDEVRDLAITHSGAILGTPYYMSPEQVRGARDVDARTDVYAFGVMLFEALTGQWPFDAETYNELILKIVTEQPRRASDVKPNLHPELIAVIERAMARDPDARFPNIESLAVALEPFAGGARFRITRATVDSSLISGDFPLSGIPTPDPRIPTPDPRTPSLEPRIPTPEPLIPVFDSILMPQKARPPRARASAIAVAVALLLGAGVGALVMRGRQVERVSIAHPAPQPKAAGDALHPMAAAEPPATGETALSAIEGVVAPTNPTDGNQTAEPRVVATKRAKHPIVLRNKREIPDPLPAPEPVAPPTASKRQPKDWDDRISTDTPRLVGAANMPAGRIDSHDFR
jgi:serine/threonine-protein kinase